MNFLVELLQYGRNARTDSIDYIPLVFFIIIVVAVVAGSVYLLAFRRRAEPRPAMPDQPRFCTNCGNSIQSTTIFCPNCGNKVK